MHNNEVLTIFFFFFRTKVQMGWQCWLIEKLYKRRKLILLCPSRNQNLNSGKNIIWIKSDLFKTNAHLNASRTFHISYGRIIIIPSKFTKVTKLSELLLFHLYSKIGNWKKYTYNPTKLPRSKSSKTQLSKHQTTIMKTVLMKTIFR